MRLCQVIGQSHIKNPINNRRWSSCAKIAKRRQRFPQKGSITDVPLDSKCVPN